MRSVVWLLLLCAACDGMVSSDVKGPSTGTGVENPPPTQQMSQTDAGGTPTIEMPPETDAGTPVVLPPTHWGDGGTILTAAEAGPASELIGYRWEVPCNAAQPANADHCSWRGTSFNGKSEVTKKIGGDPAKTYQVTIRVRGVVEGKIYTDDNKNLIVPNGPRPVFLRGGLPLAEKAHDFNVYSIAVAEPKMVFYLNAIRAEGLWVWVVDFTEKVLMKGGTSVVLGGLDTNDLLIPNTNVTARDQNENTVLNHQLRVDGIAPFPAYYNGQFLQLDVMEVGLAE